jgi:hypothetical protein
MCQRFARPFAEPLLPVPWALHSKGCHSFQQLELTPCTACTLMSSMYKRHALRNMFPHFDVHSMCFQEHASSNPGLQAFLDKKSDEHIYSALYLLAGVFCLYAAIFHGEGFCTNEPPTGVQVRMNAVATVHACRIADAPLARAHARHGEKHFCDHPTRMCAHTQYIPSLIMVSCHVFFRRRHTLSPSAGW